MKCYVCYILIYLKSGSEYFLTLQSKEFDVNVQSFIHWIVPYFVAVPILSGYSRDNEKAGEDIRWIH